MQNLVARWDQWKVTSLLKINMAIAFLILLSHVGGALVYISKSAEPKPSLLSFASWDDLVAVLLLVSGIAGLVNAQLQSRVLRLHAIVLSLLAVGWIYWGFALAIGGLPPATKFVWNPIFFAFLCAWPVYLLRRTFLASRLSSSVALNYSHVLVAGGTLLLSAAIMYRMANV